MCSLKWSTKIITNVKINVMQYVSNMEVRLISGAMQPDIPCNTESHMYVYLITLCGMSVVCVPVLF